MCICDGPRNKETNNVPLHGAAGVISSAKLNIIRFTLGEINVLWEFTTDLLFCEKRQSTTTEK